MNKLTHTCLLGVICLVSLSSCVSEKARFRSQLAIVAPAVNSQCPIDITYGSLQRIYLEEDTLCTLIRTKAEPSDLLLRVALIKLEQDTSIQSLNTLKSAFASMGQYGFWLRSRFDNPKTGRSVRLYVSPATLDSIFSGKISEKEMAIMRVRLQVQLTQSSLPRRINDQMSVTALDYTPDGDIHMTYLFDEDNTLNLGKEAVRTTAELVVRSRIWNQLMRLHDDQLQEVILLYYNAGCNMRYTCVGAESGGRVEITFTQSDLRMLLSHYGIHVP